jgi:isopenicillin N synthase-like dioxygenase
MSDLLPLIDLSPWYGDDEFEIDRLADQVDDRLQDAGFLLVTGHGVDQDVRTRTREVARRFFHQTAEAKADHRVVNRRGWLPTGYEATGYASGENDVEDLKESFTIGQEPVGAFVELPSNRWPSQPEDFHAIVWDYYAQMLRLGSDLLGLFARALGLPTDHLQNLSQHPASELNLNWYPAMDLVGAAAPGQFRIGPHSDYGCMTILDREPGRGGLQIRTRDGVWVDAPVHPEAYTINIGDLLARLTGDRWRSTPHRVLPPDPSAPSEELISMAFFHEFSDDAVIETLPAPVGGGSVYEPVRSDDYIAEKYAAVTVG